MSSSQPSDQSLLDRLNALKKSNITLQKNTIPLNPNPIPPLNATPAPELEQTPLSREDALAARLKSLRGKSGSGEGEPQSVRSGSTQPPPHPVSSETTKDPYHFEEDDLADLIDGIDEFTLDEADGRNSNNEDDNRGEAQPSGSSASHLVPGRTTKESNQAEDSDSETEHMIRSVDKILSQVQEEIHSNKQIGTAISPDPAVNGPSTTDGQDPSSSILSLPAVPSSQPLDLPLLGTADEAQDSTERRKSVEFENDIATRLASLRGLGSGVNVDAFGLPIAPNFRPEDRSAQTAASLVTKKVGYTDEDQKTWCIVCLDDATVRCIGCDNDVYCSRCWKDMHLGPRAGYDERGHKAVRFEK